MKVQVLGTEDHTPTNERTRVSLLPQVGVSEPILPRPRHMFGRGNDTTVVGTG